MRDCKIYYFLTDMTIIHWPRPLLGLPSHIYIDILSLEKTSLQREAYSLHNGSYLTLQWNCNNNKIA